MKGEKRRSLLEKWPWEPERLRLLVALVIVTFVVMGVTGLIP